MADAKNVSNATRQTLVFVYGTLKKDFPNHHLVQQLISQKEATYVGTCITHQPHPLVIGSCGIPYMLFLPGGVGHQINGELYSVTAQGLVSLDELEGTSVGHYERRPVQVTMREKSGAEEGEKGRTVVLVDAEAYFAHRSFGERMWVRCGRVGLDEYSLKRAACDYVKKVNRAEGWSFLDEIENFLSGTA
ncbi:AIG2-LIKE (AVIRULENCE INDUCED GENE) FAMILY PROTEIN [Salix viminalis]|uniref:Gamma-glutamylcyclotransferase family protein n=1 Tax=Salix viminalis TaxID=40686 RepID=A0A9Q0QCN7_SALVM|nr:AIG2-LIKE (AVIRULENCE INDUCED GENE) FAMILY PROTEIN [Salix viminalis]